MWIPFETIDFGNSSQLEQRSHFSFLDIREPLVSFEMDIGLAIGAGSDENSLRQGLR